MVLALLLAACTDDGRAPGVTGTQKSAVQVLHVPLSAQLDVLIVVDSSPAMAAHREQAVASAQALVGALDTIVDGRPDVHIGVTTTDPALGGRLRVGAAAVTGTFASDIRQNDGGRVKNYVGELRDVVGQMVDAGADGASPQPLAMASAALGDNPNNAGFLRPDAFLAVIVLAAGDDASPNAPETYAAALRATKTDPARVFSVVVHAGDTPRLAAFLAQFPHRAAGGELGAPDPGAVFALFANAQVTTLGLPCWGSRLLDIDAAAPGVQTECTAELHTSKIDLAVVACGDGETDPCYSIVDEAQCTESGLRTKLANFDQFSDGTVTLECLVSR